MDEEVKRQCNVLLEMLNLKGVYCFVITKGKEDLINEISFKRIK